MTPIVSPFPQFFDLDGSPLDAGSLYFGALHQNPETAPIVVYWDQAGTQPVPQPARTLNGYIVRNGSPAQVFTPLNYSLTVRNRRGAVVAYAPDSFASAMSAGTGIYGECRLVKSGSNIVLQPYKGTRLTIDGIANTVPDGGVSLSSAGLVDATLYYIYAFMNAGVMTLEASTTGHVTDPITRVETKNGDTTRSLVGMARTIAGPAFVDTAAQRLVASWFNHRARPLSNALLTNAPSSTTTYVELDASKRIEFLAWANGCADLAAFFTVTNPTSATVAGAIGFDGLVPEDAGGFAQPNNFIVQTSARATKELAEGYHYATMLVRSTGGTSVWQGSATVGERCSIVGTVDA
ncbi:hypothetical protein [Variovorax paradoxus]|uniref:hypothetical protein n=1 Tax=Variovorax paradoxus TaxID=34073 RepID=UPI00193264B7|nr:hypothetical protein INQ48_18000 [Variovorax paradoxus]